MYLARQLWLHIYHYHVYTHTSLIAVRFRVTVASVKLKKYTIFKIFLLCPKSPLDFVSLSHAWVSEKREELMHCCAKSSAHCRKCCTITADHAFKFAMRGGMAASVNRSKAKTLSARAWGACGTHTRWRLGMNLGGTPNPKKRQQGLKKLAFRLACMCFFYFISTKNQRILLYTLSLNQVVLSLPTHTPVVRAKWSAPSLLPSVCL